MAGRRLVFKHLVFFPSSFLVHHDIGISALPQSASFSSVMEARRANIESGGPRILRTSDRVAQFGHISFFANGVHVDSERLQTLLSRCPRSAERYAG